MYKFILPIYGVIKPTKKVKNPSLSVNWYRNAHHRESNTAKIEFKRLVKPQVEVFDPIDSKVHIKYVYYSASARLSDLDNFVGTVKKFFQDAIVECGLLEDDNTDFIVMNSEKFGGIDRDNPRVEAFIIPLDEFE